jgi:hypothetical protein
MHMRKLAMGLAAAVAVAVTLPAIAQQKAAGPTFPEGVFLKGQLPSQILARDTVLFAKVRGPDGKIIGDVEDLIMTEDSQVVGVIIGVGGFLGAGEKKIGVRLSALKFTSEGGRVVVSLPVASRAALKELEPYQRSKPPMSMVERALEKARELSDKTVATSGEAYQKAREQSGPALEQAKEKTKGFIEKAREAAKPKQ